MSLDVKVSVIMPVYNVEKYVAKAIESIQAQTLEDFELIIVDDGTPDKSGDICDAYAEKDSRIHVIHKENGGAPSARNTAIEQAKGKYFYFMDSDDWAEPDMLKDMVALAEEHDAQLVITGYFIDTYFSEDDYFTFNIVQPDAIYPDKDSFRRNAYRLFDSNMLYTPWNKLYLASYILENDLRFPDTFWDDFPFNLSVVRDVERVCVSHRQYYHFMRARTESETAAYRCNMYEKREEEHRWMTELYDYWGITDGESMEMLSRRYAERLVGCVENLTNRNCNLSYGQKRKMIKEMIRKDAAKQAVRNARPRSTLMKLMLIPIRMGNVTLTHLEGGVISCVKARDNKTFAKLKARR